MSPLGIEPEAKRRNPVAASLKNYILKCLAQALNLARTSTCARSLTSGKPIHQKQKHSITHYFFDHVFSPKYRNTTQFNNRNANSQRKICKWGKNIYRFDCQQPPPPPPPGGTVTATPPAPGSHAVRLSKENNANITKTYFIFSPVCNKGSTTKTRLKFLPKYQAIKPNM